MQRQAEYRTRHFKEEHGELERINIAIHNTAKRRLERLAAHYGVTQRAMLERLLEAEEHNVLDDMTNEEQEVYNMLRRNTDKTVR